MVTSLLRFRDIRIRGLSTALRLAFRCRLHKVGPQMPSLSAEDPLGFLPFGCFLKLGYSKMDSL